MCTSKVAATVLIKNKNSSNQWNRDQEISTGTGYYKKISGMSGIVTKKYESDIIRSKLKSDQLAALEGWDGVGFEAKTFLFNRAFSSFTCGDSHSGYVW